MVISAVNKAQGRYKKSADKKLENFLIYFTIIFILLDVIGGE